MARAVVALIAERLPHLGRWGALKSFPADVMARANAELATGSETARKSEAPG